MGAKHSEKVLAAQQARFYTKEKLASSFYVGRGIHPTKVKEDTR
jgi:hypothetical protein